MLLDTQLMSDLRKIAHDIELLGRKHQAIEKAANSLDLQSLERNLQVLAQALENAKSSICTALDILRETEIDDASNTASTYAHSLEQECQRLGLYLQNHFPEYDLPPLSEKIKIDLKNKCANVGTYKITSLDPKALAKEIHRIYKRTWADFDPERFANALIIVYDAITSGKSGEPVPLRKIHTVLAARSGISGNDGYSLKQFAVDISHFRRTELSHNSRRFRFSPPSSRGAANAIPVYNAIGKIENLSTIVIENIDHDVQQATLLTES